MELVFLIFYVMTFTTLADIFPSEPFNGLQISYSVSGAALGIPEDSGGFTNSRVVNGTLTGNELLVSGVAKASNGWGATIDVTVSVDGQNGKNFHEKKSPPNGLAEDPMSQPFSVTVTVPPDAKVAHFTITLVGNYNAGSRGLLVEGRLERSPRPLENPLADKAREWTESGPSQSSQKTDVAVPELQIIGDPESVTKIRNALDQLKEKAPKHYEVVARYIGVIKVVDSGSGMYVADNPPLFKIGKASVEQYGPDSPMSSIMLAGTIVHDAAHSKLYQDYLAENPSSAVQENVYSGQEAESKCLAAQYDAVQKMGGNEFVLADINNSIRDEYWKVDYSKRWW